MTIKTNAFIYDCFLLRVEVPGFTVHSASNLAAFSTFHFQHSYQLMAEAPLCTGRILGW